MSGRGLRVWLINLPEKPDRMWCDKCDLATSTMKFKKKKIAFQIPSSGRQVVPSGQIEKEDITKLAVAFRNLFCEGA